MAFIGHWLTKSIFIGIPITDIYILKMNKNEQHATRQIYIQSHKIRISAEAQTSEESSNVKATSTAGEQKLYEGVDCKLIGLV